MNQSSASKNERRPKAPDCKNATPPSEPDISASQTDPSDRTKQASYRLKLVSMGLQLRSQRMELYRARMYSTIVKGKAAR